MEKEAVTTPKSRRRTIKESTLLQTPKSDTVAQAELLQTPRRSVRKSIKPMQDYEDIVSKKTLRSSKKAEKQSSVEEETEHEEEHEKEKEAPKWTPAKVGRVSQKRKSRKSRKNIGKKQQEDGEQKIVVDVDVLEVIANDEDENKENVEPQELIRNRKSPKDNENKGSSIRRSQETCVSLSADKAKDQLKHGDAQTQPLSTLTMEEVKAKDKYSPKANANNQMMEYVNQHKPLTESEELLELGLNPIAVDEEFLAPIIPDKHREEESENDIKTITENVDQKDALAENKKEELDSAKEISEVQPNKIISISPKNQAVSNSTFDKSICAISGEELLNIKNTIESEETALADTKENFITPKPKELSEANTTLDSSDCIIISPEVQQLNPGLEKESKTLAPNEPDLNTSMPSLLISDDEEQEDMKEKRDNSEPLAKIPRLLINNVEHVSNTPLKVTTTHKINVVTPIVATSNTPKISKTKPYRFPTPYKRRNPFDFNNKHVETETSTEDEIDDFAQPPVVLKLTNLETKEIVLRSIRKRSLSVCDDRSSKKQLNRVTFHSPANQTTVIEELDLLISKSAKKDVRRVYGVHMDSMVSDTRNVTKRRKRSLSVDESLMMAKLKIQQAPLTPSKLKSTPLKLQPRTKIPNFAAIHQRQFNKMENLVDHVTRKAERAKVLTTSASKLRGLSAQKIGFSSNNQNIEPTKGVAGGSSVSETTHVRVGRPKALKKIDLSDNTIKSALPVATKKSEDDVDKANTTSMNLPNPQLLKNIVIVQPMPSGKKLQKMQAKKIVKPSQSIQIQQVKPAFNLSTSTAMTAATSFIKQPTCANTTTTSTTQSLADKVATRRQRHIDMFKGRLGDKTSRDKDKIELIRGVRSNRRFDLQMQHRKNLNHDHI